MKLFPAFHPFEGLTYPYPKAITLAEGQTFFDAVKAESVLKIFSNAKEQCIIQEWALLESQNPNLNYKLADDVNASISFQLPQHSSAMRHLLPVKDIIVSLLAATPKTPVLHSYFCPNYFQVWHTHHQKTNRADLPEEAQIKQLHQKFGKKSVLVRYNKSTKLVHKGCIGVLKRRRGHFLFATESVEIPITSQSQIARLVPYKIDFTSLLTHYTSIMQLLPHEYTSELPSFLSKLSVLPAKEKTKFATELAAYLTANKIPSTVGSYKGAFPIINVQPWNGSSSFICQLVYTSPVSTTYGSKNYATSIDSPIGGWYSS